MQINDPFADPDKDTANANTNAYASSGNAYDTSNNNTNAYSNTNTNAYDTTANPFDAAMNTYDNNNNNNTNTTSNNTQQQQQPAPMSVTTNASAPPMEGPAPTKASTTTTTTGATGTTTTRTTTNGGTGKSTTQRTFCREQSLGIEYGLIGFSLLLTIIAVIVNSYATVDNDSITIICGISRCDATAKNDDTSTSEDSGYLFKNCEDIGEDGTDTANEFFDDDSFLTNEELCDVYWRGIGLMIFICLHWLCTLFIFYIYFRDNKCKCLKDCEPICCIKLQEKCTNGLTRRWALYFIIINIIILCLAVVTYLVGNELFTLDSAFIDWEFNVGPSIYLCFFAIAFLIIGSVHGLYVKDVFSNEKM